MDTLLRFFVYGTLKRGRGNHGVLGNATFLGEAVTVDKNFTMFDGGFPFVSVGFDDEDAKGAIVGELYETLNKDIARNLDRLEGYPHLYDKREVDVTVLDGSTYQATIYVASEGSNARLSTKVPVKPQGRAKLLEWR